MDLENNESFLKRIDEISAAFQKAEETLKDQELLGEGIFFPAVNQLRYVGHHLIQALRQGEEAEQIEGNLNDALRHCLRSTFDSLEAQVQYYLGECMDFMEQYKRIEITPVISTYLQDMEIIENIRETIPTMRRAAEDRHQYWQKMESCSPRIE